MIKKFQAAKIYGVSERSIQRDIEDINNYLSMETERSGVLNSVISDNRRDGYKLEQYHKMKLTNSEILAICKILLDSRAFTKEEMTDMLSRFIDDNDVRANFDVINDSFPTIYRIDRIENYKVLDEHFKIPYGNRLKAG